MDNIETSIIGSSFTFGLFLIYKLIKKLRVNSDCNEKGFHLHIEGLNEQIRETKELLEVIIKDKIEKQEEIKN